MASTIRYRAERIRNVILEQAKKVERRRGQSQSQPQLGGDGIPICGPACFWHILPIELAIKIFSQCGLPDLISLQRVCRAFHELVTTNEQVISREYLRFQRYGALPSPVDRRKTHSREPEDLMILISDLFPPPKSGYNTDLYTFRYLYDIQLRLKICDKLSYYLANQVMDGYMEAQPPSKSLFSSRKERKAVHQQAKGLLQLTLTPLLVYAHFFLVTYSRARANLHDALYMDYDAGRLPAPIQPRDRSAIYHKLQKDILESPPFNNPSTLISTHHCMTLLICYLRYNINHSSENWISMLLVSSGLGRIVELFAAEKGDEGNRRQKRKQFMQNMQMDWIANEREEKASKIFSHPHGEQEGSSFPPSVSEIWFEAADYQIRNRPIPHRCSDYIVFWDNARLNIGCHHCMGNSPGYWV